MRFERSVNVVRAVAVLPVVVALVASLDVGASTGMTLEQGGVPPAPNFVAANVDGARVTLHFESSSPPTLPRTFVVEAGTARGLSNLAVFEGPLNHTTIVVNNVPVGTYYVRAREKNADGISEPSSERVVTVLGCPSPPEAPFGFGAGVLGQSVMFSWTDDTSGCAPSAYVLEAGSAPDLVDIGVLPIPLDNAFPSGTQRMFSVHGVPPGTYYVRLRGINAVGLGAPTPDLQIVIGSPCLPPARPINFQAPTLGNSVTFSWQLEPVTAPPSTSWPVKTFIEAGSAPGASNLAVFEVPPGFPGTIWGPVGTYWTRVRTANACGTSVVSEDAFVTLTSECVAPGRPMGLDIVGRRANEPSGASARWHTPTTGGVVGEYVVEIGSAPGLANVRSQAVPAHSGSTAFALIENLPTGTFFGRVRATNVCGSGQSSSEARLIVGAACEILPAPSHLTVNVNGQVAEFAWPTGGSEANPIFPESVIEIGTAEGASDILPGSTGPFGGDSFHKTFSVPLDQGHYFARVRLSDACGVSNPSIEVEFTIVP